MKETRLEILEKSILFNGNIVVAIANLMSKKENEKYAPFIYNKVIHLFANDDYNVDNYYVGIAKYDDVRYLEKGENIRELLNRNYVYEVFLNKSDISEETEESNKFVSIYYPFNKSKNDMVLFNFLLEKYHINGRYPLVKISKCNFEGHKYVIDYIDYLFDLQIQNNGKRLTYEEMINAMYEFLNMNNEEVKKLIR